jgi:Uncharacterized protein conserved in bacteria (DUF2334)
MAPTGPPRRRVRLDCMHASGAGAIPAGLPSETTDTLTQRTSAANGTNRRPTIAVALHEIEPATFERCALIRDWLDDHGIDRVTLLVVPARDLHPVGERCPEMVRWLAERRRTGDSIAQHGFQHEHCSQTALMPMRRPRMAEFVGLDGAETHRAVEAGRRVLELAGIEPDGFVAPAYAYTRVLRGILASDGALGSRFRWWAGRLRLHGVPRVPSAGAIPSRLLAPAWGLGSEGMTRRVLSPGLIRAGALLGGQTLRLDVHPRDLEHPRHMLALEWVLNHSHAREAITYDELAASGAYGILGSGASA